MKNAVVIINKLGPVVRGLSIAGHAGTFLGAASAGISTYKVVQQFQENGLSGIKGLDAADATVGWVGTAASIATTTAMILGTATPVGWVVVGGAATIYGAVRLGMFICNGE